MCISGWWYKRLSFPILVTMNETLRLIHNRRSLRAFSDRPIPPEVLLALKEATLRAPTAGNMAYYSIVEVCDREKKEKLALLCDNQPMIAKAPLVWIFLADAQKWLNYYHESGAVEKANDLPYRPIGLGDLHLALQDTIIAAHNAVIAAEALGLGSCYIGDVIENFEELSDLLHLSGSVIPGAMVIFGYPKTDNPVKLTPRCPVDSIFMKDSYREPHLKEMEAAYFEHEEQKRRIQSLPYENTGTLADFYYRRKHTSAFMREMNRSTEVMFRRWVEGDS